MTKQPNCKNCWDKGYSTEMTRIAGSGDFEGDKGFDTGFFIKKNYCNCAKGKRLRLKELKIKNIVSPKKEHCKEECKRPPLNMVANIVNNHFLDSDYQGKNWTAVRKSLIKELSQLLHQARLQEREEVIKMIEGMFEPIHESNHCDNYENGYAEACEDILQKLKTKLEE